MYTLFSESRSLCFFWAYDMRYSGIYMLCLFWTDVYFPFFGKHALLFIQVLCVVILSFHFLLKLVVDTDFDIWLVAFSTICNAVSARQVSPCWRLAQFALEQLIHIFSNLHWLMPWPYIMQLQHWAMMGTKLSICHTPKKEINFGIVTSKTVQLVCVCLF